jgi:hypothetical protein
VAVLARPFFDLWRRPPSSDLYFMASLLPHVIP